MSADIPNQQQSPRDRSWLEHAFIMCLIVLVLGWGAIRYVLPFFEAATRSKMSRVRAGMRSLGTAIEAYYVDHDTYPGWTTSTEEALLGAAYVNLSRTPTFRMRNRSALATLTTPVPYLERFDAWSEDAFSDDDATPLRYFSTDDNWILWSMGPNQVYELTMESLPHILAERDLPTAELLDLTYDPTNGTISSGDVWRMKQ